MKEWKCLEPEAILLRSSREIFRTGDGERERQHQKERERGRGGRVGEMRGGGGGYCQLSSPHQQFSIWISHGPNCHTVILIEQKQPSAGVVAHWKGSRLLRQCALCIHGSTGVRMRHLSQWITLCHCFYEYMHTVL